MGKRGRPPSPGILTPREQQVLNLIREGRTNADIGAGLAICVETVKQHVSEVLSKLGVATREEAAVWREPEREGWSRQRWAVALGGAGVIAATVAALAVLAWGVWESAEGDDTLAGAVTATATPAPTPSLTIEDPRNVQLIFVRGQTGDDPGSLWVSNLDGSGVRPLVDEEIVTQYHGFVPSDLNPFESSVVYSTIAEVLPDPNSPLSQQPPPTVKRVWKRDLETGETTLLLEYSHRLPNLPSAAITGDGDFLAYTDLDGLSILDLGTGSGTDLLGEPCTERCPIFLTPKWSPDGTMLAVERRFGEGSDPIVVVDPMSESPQIVELPGLFLGAQPFSQGRVCTFGTGQFSEAALYTTGPPEWQPDTFLQNYESPSLRTPNPTSTYSDLLLSGCAWLDLTNVVTTVHAYLDIGDRDREVVIVNVNSGETRTLGEEPPANDFPRLVPVPSRSFVVAYYPQYDDYPDSVGDSLTPEVVDPRTNRRLPILEPGDRIVDVHYSPQR